MRRQPGSIGAPGKAPESYISRLWSAVRVPSFFIPVLSSITASGAGVAASMSSRRLMMYFTGSRTAIDSAATISSVR